MTTTPTNRRKWLTRRRMLVTAGLMAILGYGWYWWENRLADEEGADETAQRGATASLTWPANRRWSEGNAVKLDLRVVRPLPSDLQQTKLKFTVTNTSTESMVFD